MSFKVGDHVFFKKEKENGTVVKLHSINRIVVEILDGMQFTVSPKELILIDSATNNVSAYGDFFYNKDKLKRKEKKLKRNDIKGVKIDLHIESINSKQSSFFKGDILQFQITTLREKLNIALKMNISKITIIHGIGSGILKSKVHKVLDEYNLSYFLLNDEGATEVIL